MDARARPKDGARAPVPLPASRVVTTDGPAIVGAARKEPAARGAGPPAGCAPVAGPLGQVAAVTTVEARRMGHAVPAIDGPP